MDYDGLSPGRGWGIPKRYWCKPTAVLFPPDEPLSPHVAAFLVRVDEVRYFMARTFEITVGEDLHHNPTLRDESVELSILFRLSVISGV